MARVLFSESVVMWLLVAVMWVGCLVVIVGVGE